MSAQDGGPAFPRNGQEHLDTQDGMSLRQYAAIKLRVPNSGTDWLDDMIREGRRMDYAGQALTGRKKQGHCDAEDIAEMAFEVAGEMLAALPFSESDVARHKAAWDMFAARGGK